MKNTKDNKFVFDFSSTDFNKNGLREVRNSVRDSGSRHDES